MDFETFFREGLLFSNDDSTKLASFMQKVCLAFGAASGMGLAMSVAGDVGRTGGQSQYGAIAVAAGFVVGASAGTLACMSVKSKLLTFLNQFSTAGQAVRALNPELRKQLQQEATAILRMAPEQVATDGLMA